jgi:hypothetical protein
VCRFVKPFTGADSKEEQRGFLMPSDPKCRKGAADAEAALKMSISDRMSLVVAVESSEEENEDESMDCSSSNDGWS